MEKVKFTQLYYFNSLIHGLDENGEVWRLAGTWDKFPSAYREVTPAETQNRVVKPITPEQVKKKEERDFEKETSLDSRLEKHRKI